MKKMNIVPARERKQTRIEYLDALKAVSIILVVFCHSVLLNRESLLGNAVMSLAWAAVPCFMMTSGALMHQAKTFSWRKYFRKIGQTYMVLSVWRLIYLVIHVLLAQWNYSVGDVFQYLFLFTDLDGVNTGFMWYMIAYLVVFLLFPITYHLFQEQNGRKALLMMGFCAGISGILIPSGTWLLDKISVFTGIPTVSLNTVNRVMPLTNYGNMIFYFIFGAFLFEYRETVAEKLRGKWFPVAAVMIGTVGLMGVKYLDTGTWRWNKTYLSNGYQHILTFLLSLGMFLFFYLYRFDRIYHSLAALIGQFTMGIYYMHFIIIIVCRTFIYPMLKGYYSFGLNCMKTLIIVFLCAFLTYLLRKLPLIRILVK